MSAPERPPGEAADLVPYCEGRWIGNEGQLEQALAAFSTDNRPQGYPGFSIRPAAPVKGAARRRWDVLWWDVHWCPFELAKLLPNGGLNPDGDNPHAVIRALDTPKGLRVDIRARDWRRDALRRYLARLVKALMRDGFTVGDEAAALVAPAPDAAPTVDGSLTWGRVKIRVTGDEARVMVGEEQRILGVADVGKRAWDALTVLADNRGSVPQGKSGPNLRKGVSRLGKYLSGRWSVVGDPIISDRKARLWQTAFACSTGPDHPTRE